MYTIIEDCSPYYIKFKATEHSAVVDICRSIVASSEYNKEFISQPLLQTDINALVKQIPLFSKLQLNEQRVNLFVSQAGIYRPPHKDGADMKFGVNFMIEVADDKCLTNWYSDELKSRPDYFEGLDNNGIQTRPLRELRNYKYKEVTPVKSMIANAGECVLFNVGMFHDWDNTQSSNRRVVLTLRPAPGSDMSFEQAKQLLFSL
ncbi:hypothetical protein UFOVP71_141 [uncultured Caudovirales phage]|uniref:Uncharacterized protein n=1 Tax=uncultured Caudovirales phage TaxID=2100421 RepID=A0A6J5T9Y6_9CAUD|nr:hypothetical protein UFOVP71_141 [uncultured Caudovirales phage]